MSAKYVTPDMLAANNASLLDQFAQMLGKNTPVAGATIKATSKKSAKPVVVAAVRATIDPDAVALNAKALAAYGFTQKTVWGKNDSACVNVIVKGEGFEITATDRATMIANVNKLNKALALLVEAE